MKKTFTFQNLIKINLLILIVLPNLTLSQSTCPKGMISYWKFDEIGGIEIFLDSFGGNNASCVGVECPSEDIGILNKARNFIGTNEINVPDDSVFDWGTNTSFTIEVWIKTTQPGMGNKVFLGKYQGGSNMAWWLGYGNNNKAIFNVRDSAGTSAQLEGNTVLNDGDWHHIVGVRNNNMSVLQIFVDGEKENEISTFFTGDFSGSDPVYIGYYLSGYHYTGLLDEVAIYDTALIENQIANHYNNGLNGLGYCDQSTDVKDDKIIPANYFLYQNYPNPFNPSTIIKYTIPQGSFISLKVYDVLGNEVAALVSEEKPAGNYEAEFNVGNLPSGVYFYRMEAGSFSSVMKLLLLK
jgi:hypothetical protein